MTRNQHHQTRAAHVPISGVVWVNLALIAVAVACLLSYVIAANSMASQTWRLSDAQDELASLLEARNGLVAQQSALEDRTVLSALAEEVGMVPTGSLAQHLVEYQPVAAR